MRVLFVTFYDFDRGMSDGATKKILQQIEVLQKNDIQVDYVFYSSKERSLYVNAEGKNILLGKYKLIKGIERPRMVKKYLKTIQYGFVYMRSPGRIDPWIIDMLKYLHCKGCKILYDFPTYPYDKDAYGLRENIDMLIDKVWRKDLHKYVERIVTYTDDKIIYGIQTISIKNGLDVRKVKPIKNFAPHEEINLLIVAVLFPHHGYERCFQGLANYYHSDRIRYKIRIHVVGDGPEYKHYRSLVKKLDIEDYVIFYGKCTGGKLDEIYEIADIGLSVFGLYKAQINISGSLKTREYLAKGIPVISGCPEDVFINQNIDFYYEFPNDASVVDMEVIVDFYERLYLKDINRKKLHERIHRFALETIDMEITMQPIIEYLEENKCVY